MLIRGGPPPPPERTERWYSQCFDGVFWGSFWRAFSALPSKFAINTCFHRWRAQNEAALARGRVAGDGPSLEFYTYPNKSPSRLGSGADQASRDLLFPA